MRYAHRDAVEKDLTRVVEIYNFAVATRDCSCDLEPTTVDARRPSFLQHTPDHRPLWVARSGPNMAQEPASLALSTRDIGFPVIDTTITFTREAKHTYRVRFSNPPPGPEYAMLYAGLQFCAARKLATESGFDRVAVVPESDSPQSGFAVFLAPGEEASKTLDQRFANAPFGSLDLLAR